MVYLIHAHPYIHPYAYGVFSTIVHFVYFRNYYWCCYFTTILPSHYCCHHIIVTTNKLCQASSFPGAAELTTQLLRLISILWLPLCQINKFGLYFPRRMLRSPILVGHQDYFLESLSGSIALFIIHLGVILFAAIYCHPWERPLIQRFQYYLPLQAKVQL